MRQPQAEPLIGEEKESPVFPNRPADSSSEVVLLLRSFGKGSRIENIDTIEPIVGVQNGISKIIKKRTMELVRPGPCNDGNLTARGETGVWGSCRSLYPEFLQGVHRDETVGPTR